MKPEYLVGRLLAVHEEYLARGPRGHRAREAIEREFENLKRLTLEQLAVAYAPPVRGKSRRLARRGT